MKRGGVHIHLSNKLFFTLIVIVAVVLLGVGVYAKVIAGGTGNPGHNIQNIGAPVGCDPGEYLVYENNPGCASQGDGVGPCWQCKSISTSVGVRNVEVIYDAKTFVECPTGKKLIGGGCECISGTLVKSRPGYDESWSCGCSPHEDSPAAYAICANY